MTFRGLLPAVFVSLCWLFVSVAEEGTSSNGTVAPKAAVTNSSSSGGNTTKDHGHFKLDVVDSSMIQRALYVLIGITVIGVFYFLVRAVRLKKSTQKKKYGLLSNYDDSVEMEAVESDEDDTLYEARSLRR